MASSLKAGSCISGLKETVLSSKTERVPGFSISYRSSQFEKSKTKFFPVLSINSSGRQLVLTNQKASRDRSIKASPQFSVPAQKPIVSRALRWWEKNLKPNMVEILSAQELVDSLLNANDRLVIVAFYSPGCGGCKALHPKICQLAEQNPNAIFLEVNYDELNTMCQRLNIHVLPFFRFYRGAEGRVSSFSCTNATLNKFKIALAKHGAERCSLGPAKGLDQSELMKLVSARELSADNLAPMSSKNGSMEDLLRRSLELSGILNKAGNNMELQEESALF